MFMNVLIFYDSKYGNTKIAAEKIAEGILSVRGIITKTSYVKDTGLENVVNCDAIVLGAPNHMGRPSQTMKQFIERLVALDLKDKKIAVFGTYSGKVRDPDRAVKKLELTAKKKLPALDMLSSTLSIRVNGVSGPIVEGELPKCLEFGRKIAAKLIDVRG
jgi:flavorubredoxin